MNARPLGIAMALSLLVHGLAAGAVAPSEDLEKRRIVERVAAFLPATQVVRTVVSPSIEPAIVREPSTMVATGTIAEPMNMPTTQSAATGPSAPQTREQPPRRALALQPAPKPSPVAAPRMPRALAVRAPEATTGIGAAATDATSTPSNLGPTAPVESPTAAPGDPATDPAGASNIAPGQTFAGPNAVAGPAPSGPSGGSSGSGADPTAIRRAWLGRLSSAAQRHLSYPHSARRLGLSGESIVAIRFGSNDAPDLAIHVSTGHASLDTAALAAVAKALRDCPKPAGLDAIHATSRPVFVPVSFQLQ